MKWWNDIDKMLTIISVFVGLVVMAQVLLFCIYFFTGRL